ncbi:CHASE2 domain-containing protein [Roseobacter ponti]|uniref:Adenylate/guanylate cyclase domain-containing protein n=1 Tax=Roseobacter ponti TaxID=1891787 RepID=A0A858SPN3_9RHOB|nr:adenylate/guanylate cyclase domain-containing protein [Roseobacter ponti]QJF49661.1 adenylate/guanylate cyclase domain-containing protein [Roseobacter ponti]
MISGRLRRWLALCAALAGAALWSLALAVPHMQGDTRVTQSIDYRLLDLRHRLAGVQETDPAVVIVAVDDETLATDAASGDNRQRLARIIRNIAASGARGLALDVVLADEGDPETDAALAGALGALPTAIAAAARFSGDESEVLLPQPVFREAARVGVVNLSADAFGTPRFAPLILVSDGQIHAALVLQAAQVFTGARAEFADGGLRLGQRTFHLEDGFFLPVRFAGPSGTVPAISAGSLLEGPQPDALEGRLVVLGFTASAVGDRFPTPFDADMPGVEVIATITSQLISGQTLRHDAHTRAWDAVHALVLTVLSVLVVLMLPLPRGIPAALGLIAVSLAGVMTLFTAGIWMSAALPLAAALPPVLIAGAMRYTRERSEAGRSARAAASLRRFQSPALASRIEQDPEYLSVPQERDLVILFVDLTGFTGLSQQLGTEGTRLLLRDFHALTTAAVETREGSVLNYMGDGALAVFGLTESTPGRAADNALDASFALVKALSDYHPAGLHNVTAGCRIGLHAGPVTLSRLGAESHQQVTVTGDSVNLASRLMEVAKSEAAVIVVSRDFADALSDPSVLDRAIARDVSIRGRMGEVSVLAFSAGAVL